MAEEDTEVPEESGDSKKKGNLLVIVLIALIVLLLGGFGALFFTGVISIGGGESKGSEEVAEHEEHHEPIYYKLEPAFVSNITYKKRSRFIQIAIEVVSTDPQAIENIKKHNPVIRNNLGILFSGITDEDISSRAGKEALRDRVLKEIQKILKEKSGVEGIDNVFFTGFVIQ